MKLFIKRALLLTAILLFAFCAIALFNYGLYKSEDMISEEDTHILILGDSNMESAIDDSILKSSVSYAASADSYFYSYLKLKEILTSDSNIDTVLLSFAPHNLFDNGWLFDDNHIYSHFRFYYFIMDWDDYKLLYHGNPRAVLASVPAIVGETFTNVAKKILGRKMVSSYGGFYALDRDILEEERVRLKNGEPLPFFRIPESFEISEDEQLYLDKIIALCESSHIKLYLLNLPKRIELLNFPRYGVDDFNKLYDLNYSQIEYLDFSRFELQEEFHADFVHLNNLGSTYFSSLIEEEGLEAISKKYKRNVSGTQNSTGSE